MSYRFARDEYGGPITCAYSERIALTKFSSMHTMNRWRSRLACLAIVGLQLFAAPILAAPVNYRVDIEAPENLSGVLRDNLDIVQWAQREDVTDDQLRQLVKTAPDQILGLLATEGYFSPVVKARLDQEETGWVVRLLVEPREPTKILSVDFRITGAIETDPDRDARMRQVRNAFILNEGMVFRQGDWDASKQGATHSLHHLRYAAARVTNSRAEIDPETRQARLSIEIDSGPPFTFGDVVVDGLHRYPASIVLNHSPIRPGDPYDEERLLTFQKRLLRSGRFASATVWASSNPVRATATPIYVNVVESAARKVELGVGLSTDRGPRGQIAYTDRHALDRALQFDTRLQIDRLSQKLVGALTLPVNEDGRAYSIEARYDKQDIQGEKRTDWSVTGARTYLVEEYKSQQLLQLLAEKRSLVDGSVNDVDALYLAQNWNWNNLDDVLAPRAGYFAGLEVGGASREIVSDDSFARTVAKGSYFLPVGTFGTVALRLETGVVFAESSENIPSAYLFRTGGDTTVRGYEYESLGVDVGGAVVGGRYLLVGSVEYIQWVTQQLGAAVFYDAGNAVDDISDYQAAVGYGVGVRWYSPIGAISLDLAYGEEVDEYRVHFTAGFVFR